MRQFPNTPTEDRTDFLWFMVAFIPVCVLVVVIVWWLSAPSVQRMLDAAGELNACAGLSAGECVAMAQEGQ
ncbi:hypothetical protein [Paracoccus sp. SY]|uniref:hypothetical protein n=1 Tax=Paracoccus sp. SY TaxID=1330255 RepID=UPI0011AF80AA|nr:hypothetical protein [Paracoccus sp. SY]